jgi:bifunctional DNA-binding transcriptional regulator/antitoxin component of YhaV-PrlF toxin-antitoxin module
MTTVRINGRNQMLVPRETRDHLGVGPGDELLVVPRTGYVILMPRPASVAKALAGSGKGLYGGARRHLKGERRSWKSHAHP